MDTPPLPEDEIFENAREISNRAERVRYVTEACAGDAALRARIENLLNAEAGAEVLFTEASVALTNAAGLLGPDDACGDRIGRYKLVEKIGEGGCAVVYLAEQEEPVRRNVALKIIKIGLDTRSFVARFEAERQALAVMDHPGIARVFDGGATQSGRPFFVMELVRGPNITAYCDRNRLSVRERLSLFIQVCQAVQHAHQKGIIHRDIKPSNILVASDGGTALPKVIDFGIAKAMEGRLSEHTLFTAFENFLGTPAYMSPEQAELSKVDVDTRSDIYSLGALLYEALTGCTPFDTTELYRENFDELRKTIREKDPLPPSERLRRIDVQDGAQRSTTSNTTLIQILKGDLDWIVLKCLEKDRSRRYQTVGELAADVSRFLNHSTVLARPPTALYRLQKLLRRHRLLFATGAVSVAGALIIGAPLVVIHQANLRAEAEIALKASRKKSARDRTQDLAANIAAIERALGRFPDYASLWNAHGLLLEESGRAQDAVRSFTRGLELAKAHPESEASESRELLLNRSRLYGSLSRIKEAGVDYCNARGLPLRDPRAPATALDLSLIYNGALTESLHDWKGVPGKDLADVPRGLQTFDGVLFDVRGIAQLNGIVANDVNIPQQGLPKAITNVPVKLKFKKLHALMGAGWQEQHGTQIAVIILHSAAGESKLPIDYGIHVSDWVAPPGQTFDAVPLERGVLVWRGENEFSRSRSRYLRLYKATWDNPHPEAEVQTIDLVSMMTHCLPFVISITVEP